MKKIIISCVLFIFMSQNVYSSSEDYINVNKLSDKDRAEIALEIQNRIERQKGLPQGFPSATEVQNYAAIGEQIGKAVGSAAKELGIVVNEFINTPVGTLTMMLIVWNFLGSMIVHVVFGSILWLAGIFIIKWWYNRVTLNCIEYDKSTRNIFGNHPILKVNYDLNPDYAVGSIMAIVLWTLLMTLIMFWGW